MAIFHNSSSRLGFENELLSLPYKFVASDVNSDHQVSEFLLSPPMATTPYAYSSQGSSQRSLAMVLALASAVVLSPLYNVKPRSDGRYYESKWNSGFVLPMVLAGLIIAIRTSSSSSSPRPSLLPSPEPSWVLRIGSSSWGLAGVLVMLMLVLYWQASVQEFFWR